MLENMSPVTWGLLRAARAKTRNSFKPYTERIGDGFRVQGSGLRVWGLNFGLLS